MTSNLRVLCLPWHNTGGHFIDWSIHYVTGQTIAKHHITDDCNWHNHKIKIVWTYDELLSILDSEHSKLTTVYFNQKMLSQCLQEIFQVRYEDANQDQLLTAAKASDHDYTQGVLACQDRGLVPAYFDYTKSDQLSIYYNNRRPAGFYGEHITRQQMLDNYHHAFFSTTPDQFGNEIWDQRELAAICFRHFDSRLCPCSENHIDSTRPHLYYNTDDVWNGFDRCLEEICHVWNLEIDQDRWCEWEPIYHKWRTVHDPYFARHLSRIVDAIVNNKYLSLRRFRMNFFMEVIIQHELIFNHNLNLKIWQLDRFPDNTQDLHKLLEPNFHQL